MCFICIHCMCTYVNLSVQVHTCCDILWTSKDNLGFQSSPSTLIQMGSLAAFLHCIFQARRLLSFGNSPVSSHIFLQESWDYRCLHYSVWLYLDPGDLNSGLHSYMAGALFVSHFVNLLVADISHLT